MQPTHPDPPEQLESDNVQRQGALPGLGGVRLDLLDPNWIVEAARESRPELVDEAEPVTEADECALDLQQGLRFTGGRRFTTDELGRGGRYDVARPSIDELTAATVLSVKRYDGAGDTGHELTSSAELASKVWHVYQHTARGLSDNDVAVMDEWTARSLDVGYLASLKSAELPFAWYRLVGTRSRCRRIVLFCLCHALANGWNGIRISATEAARLWHVSRSTWWAAIAWLEERGLLKRMNLWDPGEVRPSDKSRNWYGAGPALLDELDAVVAEFGVGEPTDEQAQALDQVHREHKRERAIRGRELRGEAQPGDDAPPWALQVAELARGEAQEREHDRVYSERARAVLDGTATVGEGVPDVDGGPGLDVDQQAELERVAAELDELPPAAELVDELDDVEGRPAAPSSTSADVGRPAPVPAPTPLAASRSSLSSPIRLPNGEPQALENPRNEPATRRAESVPAPVQDAPRRPTSSSGPRAAPKATPPPGDSWGGTDWQTRTVHYDPLATWAAANATKSDEPTSSSGGGSPRTEGECTNDANPSKRSIQSDDPGVRESARRKLREALDGKAPSMLERLQALVERLADD